MKYINSYKVFEGKQVGNLYHFTNIESIIEMARQKKIGFSPNDLGHMKQYEKWSGSISTTRRFDFKWQGVRLVLDGNKISNKFVIKPIHFFNIRGMDDDEFPRIYKNGKSYRYKEDIRQLGTKAKDNYNTEINQMEERIFGKFGDKIEFSKKFVKEIVILQSTYDEYDEDMQWEMERELRDANMKWKLVDKFKPYKK